MQQKFTNLISKFNEVVVGTTKELIETNTRAFQQYSDKQIDLINGYSERIKKQLGSVSKIKDEKGIKEYIETQTSGMQKSAETFYTSTKKSIDMITENTKEVNALMKKGMDSAAEVLKSVSGQKRN